MSIKPPSNLLFDIEGLEKACESFAPMRKFCRALEGIKESEGLRDNLDETVKAIFEFISHISVTRQDGQLNNLPLTAISDLIYALHDLNQGKNPSLLQRTMKVQNRNTKTGEGIAYDRMIAASQYIRATFNLSEKDAASLIAKKLRKMEMPWVDPKIVYGLLRTHNNESTRKGRPDARNRPIDSDEELDADLKRIAQLLKHKKQ